jgi:hypothetical protein
MPVIINGTTGIDTVQDGIVTDAKLNLTANSQEIKDSLNASGSAPIYACRAWVNFNGTGTVAIRASGNVSSITDNGTGFYTVNFSTAMPDENYAVAGTAQRPSANADNIMIVNGSSTYNQLTTTAAVIRTMDSAATAQDSIYVGVTFFR